MKTYSAHGKLLLTGEYLVLDGALALALPLKPGQQMSVEPFGDGPIVWESWHSEGLWFKVHIHPLNLQVTESWNASVAVTERLSQLFRILSMLKPKLFQGDQSYKIITRMDFHPDWGLGSSSTLISMLSEWADLDPYLLLSQTFGGSGYDVACARADGPIIYQRTPFPEHWPVDLASVYSDTLFVYTGNKMDSRKAVNAWTERGRSSPSIETVSNLTQEFVSVRTLPELMVLMREHENLMSGILGLEILKKRGFEDFEGELKSLGAWGGDFFWAASSRGMEYMHSYFRAKGHSTMFSFDEFALKPLR